MYNFTIEQYGLFSVREVIMLPLPLDQDMADAILTAAWQLLPAAKIEALALTYNGDDFVEELRAELIAIGQLQFMHEYERVGLAEMTYVMSLVQPAA
jgi:hypothetical protein